MEKSICDWDKLYGVDMEKRVRDSDKLNGKDKETATSNNRWAGLAWACWGPNPNRQWKSTRKSYTRYFSSRCVMTFYVTASSYADYNHWAIHHVRHDTVLFNINTNLSVCCRRHSLSLLFYSRSRCKGSFHPCMLSEQVTVSGNACPRVRYIRINGAWVLFFLGIFKCLICQKRNKFSS